MEKLFTNCGKKEYDQTVYTQILDLARINIVISDTFNVLFPRKILME